MTLAQIIAMLIFIGTIVVVVPMDSRIRTAVVAITLLFACFWVLHATGVVHTRLF